MSQLDATIPAQVLASLLSSGATVDGVVVRHYPNSYTDEVGGRVIKGAPAEFAVVSTPAFEFKSKHLPNPTNEVEVIDFYVIVAGSGLSVTPAKGMELFMPGEGWFQIVSVESFKTGAAVAAYQLNLSR